MPRLSRGEVQARRRIAGLAALGLSPERLGDALLEALAGAIPFDGARLFGVDAGSLLINRLLAASTNDGEARLEWLREVYLAAEPLTYLELPTLMRAGLTAVAFHDRQALCWGYPAAMLGGLADDQHYRLFHELRSPRGGTLLACFARGGRWIAALQLYRRERERPFRSSDVAFVRLLAPPIGSLLGASLNRERAALDANRAPDASGMLLLGPDGEPRLSTAAGEAWCGLLRDSGENGHGPLPTAVWSALARLRFAGADAAAGSVIVDTPIGRARVEASPAGPDGAVAVVVTRERPPLPPDLPDSWPLTRQEREVASLLLRGLSNRQVAAVLTLSENTVEWHLRHVYAKAGVHNRGQLLARLFHETLWPDLEDGEDAARSARTSG